MIRRLIERLSRGKVLRKRLPADAGGGTVFVSPDAALQFWKRGLERPGRDLFDFAASHVTRGANVWDVGANVGLFTFAAAYAAGSSGLVVAVEPDLFCADLISRSRSVQPPGQARVVIIAEAISDRPGMLEFNIAARGRSSNFLTSVSGGSQAGGTRERHWVPVASLDSLSDFLPPPGVLKIDVETAEALVLVGARRLLSRHHPVILCEVSDECRAQVTTELRGHGYRFFDWEKRNGVEIETAPWMTLALPSET